MPCSEDRTHRLPHLLGFSFIWYSIQIYKKNLTRKSISPLTTTAYQTGMTLRTCLSCKVQRASGMLVVGGTSAIRDMKIAGYHISKGIFVALNLVKLHHDEREWPEPKKFRPERFLDSNGKFVGWSKLNGFLPFSVGRRKCPGQSLAKIMMITFAFTLINCYKSELPEGEEIPTTEVFESAAVKRHEDFKIVANKQES